MHLSAPKRDEIQQCKFVSCNSSSERPDMSLLHFPTPHTMSSLKSPWRKIKKACITADIIYYHNPQSANRQILLRHATAIGCWCLCLTPYQVQSCTFINPGRKSETTRMPVVAAGEAVAASLWLVPAGHQQIQQHVETQLQLILEVRHILGSIRKLHTRLPAMVQCTHR